MTRIQEKRETRIPNAASVRAAFRRKEEAKKSSSRLSAVSKSGGQRAQRRVSALLTLFRVLGCIAWLDSESIGKLSKDRRAFPFRLN